MGDRVSISFRKKEEMFGGPTEKTTRIEESPVLFHHWGGTELPRVAFEWFKKAAEAGEVEGQFQIGVFYARGYGVQKNLEKARYWLEKAKANGYDLATNIPEFVDKK